MRHERQVEQALAVGADAVLLLVALGVLAVDVLACAAAVEAMEAAMMEVLTVVVAMTF